MNGFVGDFIGFQASLESGFHGAVHRIVGGCVDLLNVLRFCPLTQGSHRDLMGVCLSNAPADCVPSPAWSVNGAFLNGVRTLASTVLTF